MGATEFSIGQAGFLEFWGKARPADSAVISWHPVIHHLLDVAAAAEAILEARPLALARGARLLGLESVQACRLIVALASQHDLGKYAPAFQKKSPEHWPAALASIEPAAVADTHHTADGYALWEQHLSGRLADRLWVGGESTLDALAPSVFGHHGRPVCAADSRRPVASLFRGAALGAALACADAVLDVVMPAPIVAPPPPEVRARIASWWLSGLMTVADWIGSNQRWFPYEAPASDLAAYWTRARDRARHAVRRAGVAAPRIGPAKSFLEITGQRVPSPAQAWAASVALPEGALLVILEDVTGAGKTEASQMLVHRLMAAGRASGAYWAMPTQATANAMYARQAAAIRRLFDVESGGAQPSIALAHGQSRLHDGFRATVLREHDESLEPDTAREETELTADAACAAFLADDRRAALLADIGAGTVDQALLAALPSRFNGVRLFALADRVLVFDEAHAYDAYMGVEVQQLLRFQAALGGSAIVLSATLSRTQRDAIATAWEEGLHDGRRRTGGLFAGAPVPLTGSSAYPLATIVTSGAKPVREYGLDAAPWSRRTVPVCFVRSEADALARVAEAAAGGAAVAWIRNAVDDCLEAAAQVRALGVETVVFHARFAQADRQVREREVLDLFGPSGDAAVRRGTVVVATQVIEQSLDLDFDLMVTDLAPIDLLIQRAGRLRRHAAREAQRPMGVSGALVVLSPPAVDEPTKEWLPSLLPRTARVYDDVGVLWRTVRALERVGGITTPDGLRALVDDVYDTDEAPPALQEISEKAKAKRLGAASAAMHGTLALTDGYHGDQHGWVDDVRPLTRLGDEQTTVRLARVRADRTLVPWATMDGPAWKAWALSEIRLSARKVPFGSTATAGYDVAVDAARAEWGRFELEITVLPLVESDAIPGEWYGELVRPDGREVAVSYSARDGLQFGGSADRR